MSEPLVAVDLFCGGGGLSTALAEACEDLDRAVELYAINHWTKAIETHETNHSWATHLNAKVEELHPPDIVDPGSVDILIAAPECTHFSTARGGKPVEEQARASPMHVLDWVGKLQPDAILLENVPEFESWGPIVDGEPTRDGTKFDAWKAQLEADRYSVRHTTLNAADFGDATSRKRFFVMGRRDYRPEFPTPTHSKTGADGLPSWRPAAEVIDWDERGESLWARDRPLVNNTMERIAEGIRRHCHADLEPFADAVGSLTKAAVEAMQERVVPLGHAERAAEERDGPFLVERATDNRRGLCTPCLLGQHSGSVARDVTERPTPTVAARGAIQLYQPEAFLIEYYGNGGARGTDEPLPTVTTKDRFALVLPDQFPWGLDLRYRMLQPRELAAAQGFPSDYEFVGTKTQVTKQIGNAVPVNLGKSLVKSLILPTNQPTMSSFEESPAVASDGGVSDD